MSDGTLKLGRPSFKGERAPVRTVCFKLDAESEAALARILADDSDPLIKTGQLSSTIRRLILEEDERRQKTRSPRKR